MSYLYKTPSSQIVERFLAARAPRPKPKRQKPGPKVPPPRYVAPTTTALAKEWRDYLLTHISFHIPKRANAIWRSVFDDWGGDINIRRVHRGLARLMAEGSVVRTAEGYLRGRR